MLVKDKTLSFKGGIKSSKHYASVKKRRYGVKTKDLIQKSPKSMKIKARKSLIKESPKLVTPAVLTSGLIIKTGIKATEQGGQEGNGGNEPFDAGAIESLRQVQTSIKKSYDASNGKSQKQEKKQNKKLNRQVEQVYGESTHGKPHDAYVKTDKQRHVSNVIDNNHSQIKGVSGKSSNNKRVKASGAKVVNKSAAKKAGIKVAETTTAQTTIIAKPNGFKKVVTSASKSTYLAMKKMVVGIGAKLGLPIAMLILTLILIVLVVVMIFAGTTESFNRMFIPIEEEVLVTAMHVHLTSLDIERNVDGRTDTKDVIALHFMAGIDFDRDNDDDIMKSLDEFHKQFHSGDYQTQTVVDFLGSNNMFAIDADDFEEYKQFAFINFYDTVGDPYQDEWQHLITSHFGYRPDPWGVGEPEFHTGIDVGKPGGTPIQATISGVVSRVQVSDVGYGNMVVIVNKEDQTETRYAHLDTISVRAGQQIRRGAIVGTTGTTGNSTGDHLHYEFYREGNLLNPYFYFPPLDPEIFEGLELN